MRWWCGGRRWRRGPTPRPTSPRAGARRRGPPTPSRSRSPPGRATSGTTTSPRPRSPTPSPTGPPTRPTPSPPAGRTPTSTCSPRGRRWRRPATPSASSGKRSDYAMPDLSTNVQAGQAGHPALHNAERTEINALRARRVITPRDFGDLPSYNNLDTDCTDVLEAFLEAAAEDDSREFALEGAYGITRGLVVSGLARRSMRCALEIKALTEIEGYGLSFEAVTHKSLPGYCVYDNQTTNYRNRLAHRGFLVGPAAFNARLPDLHATGV